MATGEGYEQFGEDFWGDPWVCELLRGGRSNELLLFEWMWTGPLRTTSALVRVPFDALRGHLPLPLGPVRYRQMVERACAQPGAGLVWFPQIEYFWVKNYIRRRARQPNLLISAVKDLRRHPPELAGLVALYNRGRGLDLTGLPCWSEYLAHLPQEALDTGTLRERFGMDLETLLKPFWQTRGRQDSDTDTREQTVGPAADGSAKGSPEPPPPPPPRPTWQAEAAALRSIPGYPFDEDKDGGVMTALAEAYPQLNLAGEVRKLKAWLASKGRLPMRGQMGPRQQVRNWIRKADEFGATDRRRPEPENVGEAWRRHAKSG